MIAEELINIQKEAYVLFHLNLDYSSIPDSKRAEVIRACYWPILELQEKEGVPIGIEASGSTIEKIGELDPAWVSTFAGLLEKGDMFLVAGGYRQIIAPLVPPAVTLKNLELGNQVYLTHLKYKPTVVLPSEMAISDGSALLYAEAGFDGVMVDIDNGPGSRNLDGSTTRHMVPGANIEIRWASSVIYQWVHQYLHNDLELESLTERIRYRSSLWPRQSSFPLYSGDAEAIGFRAGRFEAERSTRGVEEWARFGVLVDHLQSEGMIFLNLPSSAQVETPPNFDDREEVSLTEASELVSVKKQPKYNVTRWAVTGRGDFELNAMCWTEFERISKLASVRDLDWRRLCELWSSDYRTHIDDGSWAPLEEAIVARRQALSTPVDSVQSPVSSVDASEGFQLIGNTLVFENAAVEIKFDLTRGLSISSYRLSTNARALFGHVPHGRLRNIRYSPDWYSGNLVYRGAGGQQVTDLDKVRPLFYQTANASGVKIEVSTSRGLIYKEVEIERDSGVMDVRYGLPAFPRAGQLRIGHISIFRPSAEATSIFIETHNGGRLATTMSFADGEFDMGAAVNSLV